jgi:large subunit ribosomal protein L10
MSTVTTRRRATSPSARGRGEGSETPLGGPGGGERVSAIRARKQAKVEELSLRLRQSEGILLADYRGLKVREMGELRRRLAQAQADMAVVKNTSLRLALERFAGDEQGQRTFEIPERMIEGPTAVIFCGRDVVQVAKAVSAFAKESARGRPVLKGGHIEGKAIEAAQALKLATLPSRQELIAQLVQAVAAPRQLFVSGLQAVVSRLVGTLQAFAEKGGAGQRSLG